MRIPIAFFAVLFVTCGTVFAGGHDMLVVIQQQRAVVLSAPTVTTLAVQPRATILSVPSTLVVTANTRVASPVLFFPRLRALAALRAAGVSVVAPRATVLVQPSVAEVRVQSECGCQ